MTDFPTHFRDLVLPRLRRQCVFRGLMVECGQEDFTTAFAAVFRQAARLGALHLAPDKVDALEDWIGSQILKGADAAADAVRASRSTSDKVGADIRRWEEALCMEMT